MTRTPDGRLPLSPRELQVVEAAAEGLVNKEIAAKLNISPATVSAYMGSVLLKLHARSRAHAVGIWLGSKLGSPSVLDAATANVQPSRRRR